MSKSAEVAPSKMVILGLGWFGFQIFWAFHGGPLPLFLRGFTDSKLTISLVLSLAGLAGCLVPFAAGYLSDRSVTRFGRRRPYVFLGFFVVLLCLLALPHVSGFGSVILVAGSMYFALRLAETPYLALLPDITPAEQRSTASGVMNLIGSLGLIFCFGLSKLLWDANPNGLIRLLAAISFGTVFLAITLIREPTVAPLSAAPAVRPIAYLRGIAQETSALLFFAAQFFWWLGFWMVSTFATLFVVEELEVAEGDSFLVLLPFTVVSTLCVLPLGMLGDRYGRKAILSVAIVFWAMSELMVGLSQNLTQAIVTVGISAIPFAAIMGVGYAYMLDLVPSARTAEFVGFSVISTAASQIVGPLVGGVLIDTLGYRSIFPATAAFMMIGFFLLRRVPAATQEQ